MVWHNYVRHKLKADVFSNQRDFTVCYCSYCSTYWTLIESVPVTWSHWKLYKWYPKHIPKIDMRQKARSHRTQSVYRRVRLHRQCSILQTTLFDCQTRCYYHPRIALTKKKHFDRVQTDSSIIHKGNTFYTRANKKVIEI